MSLKKLFIGISSAFMLLILAAALSLVLITSRFRATAQDLVNRAESVHAAEELQVHLRTHGRQVRQLRLTRKLVYRAEIETEKNEIARWLAECRKLVTSNEEKSLVETVEAVTRDYLKLSDSLLDLHLPESQIGMRETDALAATNRATEQLAELNLEQAKELRDAASHDRDEAKLIAFGLASISLLLIGIIFMVIRLWIFKPTRELLAAISNFSGEKPLSRAPETGPEELAMIASRFNRLTDQLVDQRSARLEFLASVAHDLRNPLGAIQMATQLLEGHGQLNPDATAIVELISRQIANLGRLVGDLLDTAQIESGRVELRLNRENLNKLVEQAVSLHKLVSPLHRIEYRAPPTEFISMVDPVRVSQALNNLLSNAIKYSPSGGLIQVELSTATHNVAVIRVADEGIGIAEDERAHIFEPFHRTKMTRGSIPGLGLGLSITKKIIEAHHGHIHVEPRSPRGSVFTITLPLLSENLKNQGRILSFPRLESRTSEP